VKIFIMIAVSIFGALINQADASPMPSHWKALLRQLVEVNTETRNTAGLERIREILVPQFQALGMQSTIIDLPEGRRILSFQTPQARPKILWVGHLDTVFSVNHTVGEYREDGDKIHGPGVIDMKSGIVLMLHLLSELKNTPYLHQIRIVLNDDEENGSRFSRSTLQELARGIPYGLVFEPGLPGGEVVIAHSGVQWLNLTVRGKSSHAGLEPELGINACIEASYKAGELAKLSDYSRGLSLNVGTIQGGTHPNVVCEQATLRLDIRYRERADLKQMLLEIMQIKEKMTVYNPILNQYPTATLDTIAELPNMPASATSLLFDRLQTTAKRIGMRVSGRPVGYASDGNHLATTGINLLVGLGPYGGGMHTNDEYLLQSSYLERFALNLNFIKSILKPRKNP